ncbi:RNA-directed DNA polymerase, eukaryota, reverse transcriptase zinc-binding domain protein [Tanacetum coccineum]
MEGVQYVVENRPWMINNKPMIVHEWDHEVNIEKREPSVLPVWVKLKNVIMEAWTKKGISVLASNLGKPIIMDVMTTMMCNQGAEGIGFGKVRVKINATKECKDSIKVQYADAQKVKMKTKIMQVEYQWKPVRCNHCKVYGHGLIECKKRPRTEDELKHNKGRRMEKDILKENNSEADMRNRNEENVNKVPKEDVNKGQKEDGKKLETIKSGVRKNANGKWFVNQNVMDYVKFSANKYVVLQEDYDEEFSPYISPIKQNELNKVIEKDDEEIQEDVFDDYYKIGEFLKVNELRNEGKNVLAEGGVDDVDQNFRLFYTFIYASNNGRERRELWKNLVVYKFITNGKPWGITRYFNVTLKIDEHNDEMSHSTIDVQEFQKCVEEIEMEDLNGSGFQFT